MSAVSLVYALAYLPGISFAQLPIWLLITIFYGLALAAGLVLTNGLLWAVVLGLRRFGLAAAGPGVLLQAIACCAGSDIGWLFAEYGMWGMFGQRPRVSPIILINICWIGVAFLLLRLAVRYAARYRRIKATTKIAQGQVLANQLKPHFLFNSLHALSELIETDAQQGAEMAHRLSELFRRIADGARHATTPLSEELAVVREYLEIEKVRLGARLRYAIDEPAWSSDRHVPTLMLQTLVENAIKHGISPAVEGGELTVSFREVEGGLYECTVTNTGMPLAAGQAENGVGLANTRERLRQLYGDAGTLRLDAVDGATRACFVFRGEALAQNLGR
jgi:signal transduction histidine kinase